MRERLISFMMGRNGPDALYNFTMYVCLALIILNLFFRSFVLSGLYLVFFGYALFRMMSRNVYKRQKENAAFINARRKFLSPFKLACSRFRDRKTHVYKKCPNCKKVLRLPKRIGNHTVSCPCCHSRFDITIK